MSDTIRNVELVTQVGGDEPGLLVTFTDDDGNWNMHMPLFTLFVYNETPLP